MNTINSDEQRKKEINQKAERDPDGMKCLLLISLILEFVGRLSELDSCVFIRVRLVSVADSI